LFCIDVLYYLIWSKSNVVDAIFFSCYESVQRFFHVQIRSIQMLEFGVRIENRIPRSKDHWLGRRVPGWQDHQILGKSTDVTAKSQIIKINWTFFNQKNCLLYCSMISHNSEKNSTLTLTPSFIPSFPNDDNNIILPVFVDCG